MKTVKIRIKGDLLVLDYCNVELDFLDNYYCTCAWDKSYMEDQSGRNRRSHI